MTENYPPASTPPPGWSDPLPPRPEPVSQEPPGTADVVKDQAADLGQSGVQAGKHTVEVTREQASNVAAEAGRQGRDLLRQAQDQVGEQAAQGQQRLAAELLSLSDELSSMADGSDQGGVAADLARQAASRTRDAGQWLDDRKPAQVIDDVQAFARRRPGVFLALAVGAGLVAGRLTRGLAAASSDDDQADAPAPALPGDRPGFSGQRPQPATDPRYQPHAAGDIAYQADAAVASDDGMVVPVVDGLPAAGGGSVWDGDRERGVIGADYPDSEGRP